MKIATWNLERPAASGRRNGGLIAQLAALDADLLVLTESNECIQPGLGYRYFHSDALPAPYYRSGERRTTICSRYPLVQSYPTFRSDTAICHEFETDRGNLIVYATVIGIFGNRRSCFMNDLRLQVRDWQALQKPGTAFCVAGDFNQSFGDNYYFTGSGRSAIVSAFSQLAMENATAQLPCNIDHIAVSETFLQHRDVAVETWNGDKSLSDHIGVCVTVC